MHILANFFKGLSDPIRLAIVGLLLEQQELCVCDLIAALSLPQSTTSRHLSYLKRTGWLSSRQQGLWMYYSISVPMQTEHPGLLAAVAGELSGSSDMAEILQRLERYRNRPAKNC